MVMLLGIWMMTNDQSAWETRDVVFAVLALLAVVLLLVGIDIRGRGARRQIEYHDEDESP
jgi:hypothetical protein